MRRQLTEQNKSDLKNQCKMGMSISLMAFMFVTVIGVTVYEMLFDADRTTLNSKMDMLIAAGVLLFAVLLQFLINYKYYSDIRNNEKVLHTKILAHKSKSIDPMTLNGANFSKGYINRFEFIVDNIKVRVDEELYKSCEEGDKIIFSYAPKSKYLLNIERSK